MSDQLTGVLEAAGFSWDGLSQSSRFRERSCEERDCAGAMVACGTRMQMRMRMLVRVTTQWIGRILMMMRGIFMCLIMGWEGEGCGGAMMPEC